MRFDRWCKKHLPDLPFGQMQRLLRTGQFRLDGKRVDAGERVAMGQTVRVPPLPTATVEADRSIARGYHPRPEDAALIRSLVIYEDEQVVAINKPNGLAVQGGSGTVRHVERHARSPERPG